MVFYCDCLHSDNFKLSNPRHPAGLIKHLKRIRAKIDNVRRELFDLPDPFIRSTYDADFDLDNLKNIDLVHDHYAGKYSSISTSAHNSLTDAAIILAMHIANAVKSQHIDRKQSPKTNFSTAMVKQYEDANKNNRASSSKKSNFADFYALAYYIATGEEGEFFEHPVKIAIRQNKEAIDYDQNEDEGYEQFETEFSDGILRNQITNAKWVFENIPPINGQEVMVLHFIIQSGLRGLKAPTKTEEDELESYNRKVDNSLSEVGYNTPVKIRVGSHPT